MGKKKSLKDKAKANLKGKGRELDSMDKILKNRLTDEPLTETQQIKYDRYLLIINYRLSGITGRLLVKMLRDDKRDLFKDLSDSRINGIIYESIKYFGKYNDIDKQAERMLLAGQLDEIALKLRKENNYELCVKVMVESAKLKGLYDNSIIIEPMPMPHNVLSSGKEAEKKLVDSDVEDAVEDYEENR